MVDGTQELEQHDQPATEQVHFCRTYIRPPMPKDENDLVADYERSSPAAQAGVKLFVLLFLIIVGTDIVRLFAIPWVVGVCVGCIAVAAISLFWCIAPWRFDLRLAREKVPEIPPVGSRLHCVGAPSDLPQLADLQSVAFEPRVYRSSSASQMLMQGAALFALVPVVGSLGHDVGHYGWSTLFIAALTAVSLVIWLRPLYFRISPGRLEVLRYGFLKRNPVEVERYDLRRSYIVADFRMHRVTVSESDKKSSNYSLVLMPQRREFVSTLFMAAVSEYNAPELPVETL